MENIGNEPHSVSQEALDRLAAIGSEGLIGRIVSAVALLAVAAALILLVILINREQSRVDELKRANAKIEALTLEARRANDRAKALLGGQATGTPGVADALRQIGIADANLDAAATVKPTMTTPADVKTIVLAAPTILKRDQVLARGITSGWDIDVFWCPNSAGDANYAAAAKVANFLATAASRESNIGIGMRLGRVRLRVAPPVLQRDWEGENGVVFDDSTGDQAAAMTLLSYIGETTEGSFRPLHSVGQQTPYYLSVKICALTS